MTAEEQKKAIRKSLGDTLELMALHVRLHDEHKIASILMTVSGSIMDGSDDELAEITKQHSIRQIQKYSQRN